MSRPAARLNQLAICCLVCFLAMFSVGRAFQSRLFSRAGSSHKPSSHRFGPSITRFRSKVALNDAVVDVKPTIDADMGIYSLPASLKTTKKAGVKYQFTHQSLPEETMYIFDGTAMLFASYFMSAAAHTSYNATEKSNNTVPTPSAVLSHDLNAKIVSTMSDDQIREMMVTFEKMDNAQSKPAVHVEMSSSNAALKAGGAAEVTTEDRAAVQLRCEPLVMMLMQFARLVRDIKPKYLAVAFDAGRKTFRKDLYPAYKLQRTQTPAILVPLFPLTIRVLEAVGCVCLAEVGFEADDLMASLGSWARDRGLNVVHFSQDKDMLQLVQPGVHVMLPKGREMVDAEHVQAKYNITHPGQMRDLQALMGDSADNIPGVKGVGAKAAAALLHHFHSVPEMYEKLGLVGLAPVPAELAEASPSSPLLKAHVEEVMGKEKVEHALAQLMVCFDGSRAKAVTALNKLYLCGYENIVLYRQLVTLKEDIDIEAIVLHGASASNKVDRLLQVKVPVPVEVMMATADIPQTPASSSAQVHDLVAAMEDVLVDHSTTSLLNGEEQAGRSNDNLHAEGSNVSESGVSAGATRLTTAYFRYKGERGAQVVPSPSTPAKSGKKKKGTKDVPAVEIEPRSAEEVEALLMEISPALAEPLQLLRQQYHKLPKD